MGYRTKSLLREGTRRRLHKKGPKPRSWPVGIDRAAALVATGAGVNTSGVSVPESRILRRSLGFRVPGLSVPRPQRRNADDRELALRWGSPREGAKDLARIRKLTEALQERVGLRLDDGRTQFGKRVSFDDARRRPFHRWYFYKEGFSPLLLSLVLKKIEVPARGGFLDPFAGVGTSVLAALRLKEQPFTHAHGIEYNPFARFVGDTKLRWGPVQPRRLRDLVEKITCYRPRTLPPLPDSATLRNRHIFSRSRIASLLAISAGIDHYARRGAERDVLRVALASVLESTSFAKKDGRALRIVSADERNAPPRGLFRSAVLTIARDIEDEREREKLRRIMRRSRRRIPARIYRGDARRLPKAIRKSSISLALYSPPYLNGIDYSEVYKVEEYMLGFVASSDELRQLREGTLRSHASIRFAQRSSVLDDLPGQLLVRRLIRAIEAFIAEHEPRGFQRQYAWLVPAYFADMADALAEQYRVLKPGGYAVCIVGNSMLAGPALEVVAQERTRYPRWQLPIATDVIIAAIAKALRFEVLPSYAVRALYPRNVPKASSRESILIIRKPVASGR